MKTNKQTNKQTKIQTETETQKQILVDPDDKSETFCKNISIWKQVYQFAAIFLLCQWILRHYWYLAAVAHKCVDSKNAIITMETNSHSSNGTRNTNLICDFHFSRFIGLTFCIADLAHVCVYRNIPFDDFPRAWCLRHEMPEWKFSRWSGDSIWAY